MVVPGVVLVAEHIRKVAKKKNGNSAAVESQIEQYLKDPLSERRTTAAIQKDLDEIGILCLSEEPDNRELWKIYADDGNGVCLMLQSLEIFPAKSVGPIYGPFDVKYSDGDKAPYDPRRDPLVQSDDHLLRKRTQWAYQKEWRFIRHRYGNHSTVGFYPLPASALIGLIFGWRLNPEEITEIRRWANAGPFRPRLFQAELRDAEIRIAGFEVKRQYSRS
jgi:hypothetical protein